MTPITKRQIDSMGAFFELIQYLYPPLQQPEKIAEIQQIHPHNFST